MPGMYSKLFYQLAFEMNFTFTLFKRKDGQFGSFDGNKTTGMINDLVDGIADFGKRSGLTLKLINSKLILNLIKFLIKPHYFQVLPTLA